MKITLIREERESGKEAVSTQENGHVDGKAENREQDRIHYGAA